MMILIYTLAVIGTLTVLAAAANRIATRAECQRRAADAHKWSNGGRPR
jgi:hypothetical protein